MSTHHDLWLLSCTRRRSIVFWVHSPKLDCGLWHWISLDPLWLPAVSPSSSSPWSLLLGHHKCRTKLRYCRIPQGLDCTPCKQWSWWQLAHWEKNWQLYLTIEWILFNPPYFLAPENIEFCIYMPCFLQSSTIIIHIKKALLKRVAHLPKYMSTSLRVMRAHYDIMHAAGRRMTMVSVPASIACCTVLSCAASLQRANQDCIILAQSRHDPISDWPMDAIGRVKGTRIHKLCVFPPLFLAGRTLGNLLGVPIFFNWAWSYLLDAFMALNILAKLCPNTGVVPPEWSSSPSMWYIGYWGMRRIFWDT